MTKTLTGFLFLSFFGLISYLFLTQNQQPTVLRLFGLFLTPSLPLAVWMLAFFSSGLLTSLLWQWFSYAPTAQAKSQKPVAPLQDKEVEKPQVKYSNPNPDREVEKKPVTNPVPTPSSKPPGSTYSYSYPQASPKDKQNSTDQVYDADYRILRDGPYQPQDEDDEEWI